MNIKELQQAVALLSPDELAEFAQWFDSFWEAEWDRQIEAEMTAKGSDVVEESLDSIFGENR